MTLSRLVLVSCLAAVALPAPRVAFAETAQEKAARRHYDRAEKQFALGKFDEALENYQKAYDADPRPGFLFNIGQCHRNLGDYDAAIFSFKRYLKLDPEAENKEQVEELIEELETKKAEADTERLRLGKRKKQQEEDDPGPRETTEGAPVYKKWWFWTTAAVVGVAGGVGIYYATKSGGGAPGTDLGNIDYPK